MIVPIILQIKASLLLGLFSLMILHQTIPHLHHENQEKHSHKTAEHGHTHEHQHQKDKSEDSIDLFAILLAMHSHGNSSEIPVVQISYEQVSIDKVNTQNSSKGLGNFTFSYSFYSDAETALLKKFQTANQLL